MPDQLAHDGHGDLLRCLRKDVEPDRSVHTVQGRGEGAKKSARAELASAVPRAPAAQRQKKRERRAEKSAAGGGGKKRKKEKKAEAAESEGAAPESE